MKVEKKSIQVIDYEDLERLKEIHFSLTRVRLNDEEALEMGLRLLNTVKVLTQPLPIETEVVS